MRSLSRAAVRRRAPKPPNGAVLAYRSALRRALAAQQAKLLAHILASYAPVELADCKAWMRRDAAADGSLDVAINIDPRVLDTVGRRVAKKTHDETKRLIGISRTSEGIDRTTIDAFRKRNLSLISTLQQTQVEQLRDVLEQATEEGWHVKQLREAVEERFDVTKSHADLIARDQTLKLNGQLTQARQTSVGISEYIWSTSDDERVRDGEKGGADHKALDGTRQSWADPPDNGVGERVHPGEDFQCRCTAVAVVPWLDDEDEEAA